MNNYMDDRPHATSIGRALGRTRAEVGKGPNADEKALIRRVKNKQYYGMYDRLAKALLDS